MLVPSDKDCQRMLAKLGLYTGAIDGLIGERTQLATRAFQRRWGLTVDGLLGARTRRTLAYIACDRVIV